MTKVCFPKRIQLSIYGCLEAVTNGLGTVTEHFDWTGAVADAAILAGLSFFGAMAGASILGVDIGRTLGAAAITAGTEFFGILALKRQLVKKAE